MWSPANPDFSKNVGSMFLIASWHELFFAYTPDSYQPRLHNVASLIDELAEVSERWCSEPRFHSHVTKIQDELAIAIEDEADILEKLPEYRSRSTYLTGELSPRAVLTGCQLLAEPRDRYEQTSIDLAAQAMELLPKEKKSAHRKIRRVATLAFQHGKEDNDVWEPLNKDQSRDTGQVFDDILTLTKPTSKKYKCTLAVLGPVTESKSTLRMAGFSLISKSSLPASYTVDFGTVHDGLMFVGMEVVSNSIRHAVAICRKQLGIATGLINLYQNSNSLQIHPVALVQVDGTDIRFPQSEQAFRRLYPRAMLRSDIKEGLDLLTKKQQNDKRLLGAIELLSLASASSDSRVRLINLWSAIESLSGGHEGETTLERVSSLLVPLFTCRYVSRVARYLAIETQKFGTVIKNFQYGVGFPQSKEDYVSPQDMMKALASPEDSPPICELLKFVEHPLLRYRLWRTWETLHEPAKLRTLLIDTRQYLNWHIARIYRARNLLTHQGEEPPFLVPLLDNLQIYLAMAVQCLIHELKVHSTWDIRHAIESWNGKMEHILTSLQQNPHVLSVRDFIGGKSNDVLWPAKA